MTEQTNLITVYRSRPYPGEFFSVAYLQEGTPVAYPFTTTPVPDELQDKLVRFDWSTKQWIDTSDEAYLAQLNALQSQNTALTKQLAAAQSAGLKNQETIKAQQQQLIALTKQLAALHVTTEQPEEDNKEEA